LCYKKNNVVGEQEWLKELVNENNKLPKEKSIQEIQKGIYNGKDVYYVVMPCCDQPNPLYDVNGNIICYPSGGFSGNGNGKCNSFKNEFKGTIIWKK
jgi:hypothetical protein